MGVSSEERVDMPTTLLSLLIAVAAVLPEFVMVE